ncbi:MAG: class I SAM-dependent methyltransferase [Lutibacter sp.]|uniref:class I SAM-dependent methyltransferase n=1 Tax=Lutibacter sp. TaxID=1925666 RepID=UPI0017A310E2|nr:class I SAM-dependent methyltransferase [Lutibacter sp.]MBT8316556.1 class I SAM-dependent methyltransferase [Lutibacter sp.]NNJ57416.1 class I SAM-dependent methyltransferase [Lutibacter sp.]
MDENYEKFFQVNKETWDKKVSIHAKSEFYDIEGFKKGKSSLNSYELNELGDVKGKSLLHLQCHFGQDTLSLSRLGATCTGIDFSSEGIKQAKTLNKELGLDAKFIESNLYDVPKNVKGKFDIVFTSYGVVGWLPDLEKWAQIIADKLKPGGVFYLIEFHPIVWMFDFLETPPKLTYPYLNGGAIYEEYKGTYTNNDAEIISKEYGWNHGLGEVVSSLINAGLEIEFLHEFEKSPYNSFPKMEKTSDGMFVLTEGQRMIPLLYSIRAIKK